MATMTAYESLLLEYKPRPIRNEVAYRRALRQVEKLMRRRRTNAEDELLELLSSLIAQFESRIDPAPEVTVGDMLAHLIEVRGVSQAELCRETGLSRSTLGGILGGERLVSKNHAAKLARYFHVSPTAFLAGAE